MEHSHVLYDSDPHFKIDPISRNIINESSTKVRLIQHDHNSERFTFECPRHIEGHDLVTCNVVEIHYLNIESNSKKTKEGVYTVDDLQAKADDDNTVVCSWRISNNATQYAGMLSFLIRFSCVSDDNTLEYAWNTAPYSGITVASGIYNTDVVEEEYADVLEQWRKDLFSNTLVSVEQTKFGDSDGGENVWTATFGDGRTSELKVKNGSRGATGYIGSIETINGEPLHFFVGMQAEYEALSDAEKQNLFAIISDDRTEELMLAFLNEHEMWKQGVVSGSDFVPKAETAFKDIEGRVISETYATHSDISTQTLVPQIATDELRSRLELDVAKPTNWGDNVILSAAGYYYFQVYWNTQNNTEHYYDFGIVYWEVLRDVTVVKKIAGIEATLNINGNGVVTCTCGTGKTSMLRIARLFYNNYHYLDMV